MSNSRQQSQHIHLPNSLNLFQNMCIHCSVESQCKCDISTLNTRHCIYIHTNIGNAFYLNLQSGYNYITHFLISCHTLHNTGHKCYQQVSIFHPHSESMFKHWFTIWLLEVASNLLIYYRKDQLSLYHNIMIYLRSCVVTQYTANTLILLVILQL